MRLRFAGLVPLAALVCLPVLAVPATAQQAPERRYVLVFSAGTSPEDGAREVRARGGRVEQVLQRVFSGAVVQLTDAAAAGLSRNPRVALVEADSPVRAQGTQLSPPWGLDRVDQSSLPLNRSFIAAATGRGVTAYVVDTGIRPDHVDFDGRVDSGATVFDDGRGTSDCNGHGTHVAGTVGGRTYGVAKAVRLVPVRVLDCNGDGSVSGIVAGLDWVIRTHGATGRSAVATLALAGAASRTLDDAVRATSDAGVVVVAAAGNENQDACTLSPARVPVAVTVGATDPTDARAPYSNHGRCLDLFAPGSGTVSAWPTSTTARATLDGTSMAVPHVAGAVAALLQLEPSLSPAAVSDRLAGTATKGAVTSPGAETPNRLLSTAVVPGPYSASSAGKGTADLLVRGGGGAAVLMPWSETAGAAEPTFLGGQIIGAPAAGVRSRGALDVVARGTDNQVWTRARADDGTWAAWAPLGGVLTSRPAAAGTGGGRLDVVGRGSDGALWQRFSPSSGSWSGWQSLGGQVLPGTAPALTWVSSSRLVVVVVGTDRQLWQRTWVPDTGWSHWQPLGGVTDADVSIAPAGPGEVHVTVRGTDGAAWGRVLRPTGDSAWQRLGGALAAAPASASAPGSGQVELFAVPTDGSLLRGTWMAGWSGWSVG